MSATIHHPLFGRTLLPDEERRQSRRASLRRLLVAARLRAGAALGTWLSTLAEPRREHAEERHDGLSVFHRWAASELAARDPAFARVRRTARR